MLDLILITVVLLLIFGGGRLREAGSDLGAAVKRLRGVLRGARPPAAGAPDAEFPEVLAERAARGGRNHG